jgi:outer membrane protein OmpA-like peptidoglycan-associated protein
MIVKNIFFYIFFLFLVSANCQQNIIYNGDFEIYDNCPEDYTHYLEGITELVPGWFISNTSTPDYFNRCSIKSKVGVPNNFAGNMEPHGGNAYVGMILRADSNRYLFSRGYNEHLQTIVATPLERNKLYCLQFYYTLSTYSGIASNGLSVYISNSRPILDEAAENYSFIPQLEIKHDSILSEQKKWNLFSGLFMASGEEKYITIGNFTNYDETKYITIVKQATSEIHSFAYYLFDDFKLYKVKNESECICNVVQNQLDSFPDTGFEINDTLFMENIEIGEVIILRNIYFEFDKTQLLPHSYTELNKIYDILTMYPKMTIEILGHTDNIGNERYNQALSEARAKSVLEYLYNKGIELSRMKYFGYGSKLPIADNNFPEGRKLNRRVEIKILSK